MKTLIFAILNHLFLWKRIQHPTEESLAFEFFPPPWNSSNNSDNNSKNNNELYLTKEHLQQSVLPGVPDKI